MTATSKSALPNAPDLKPTEPITQGQFEISIVLPCLNESETVGICVGKALSALHASKIVGEVIVADNGSTDGSQQIATESGARVVDIAEKGYGNALRGGIKAARGTFVLMADADDSYDLGHTPRFLEKLRQGADLVMGNRFHGGIAENAMPPLHRYLGNPVLTAIGKLFFKSKCSDFHCGIRAFRKSAIEAMDLRSTGMEFASELVVKATLMGLKIDEVPTTLSPDGRSHPPHLRTWRDGWRHLRFLLMYSPRWLFLYPGVTLMVLGSVICSLLLPHSVHIGRVGFDIHTLLFGFVAIMLGFQFVAFATFTKVFAISEGLLPHDPRLSAATKYLTLEGGLLIGTLLSIAGIGGSIFSVSDWGAKNFGALDPSQMLRLVMPSVFSLMLGIQLICASFFLSILGLKRR